MEIVPLHVVMGKIISRLHQVGHYLIDHGHYDMGREVFETLSLGDDSYENGDFAYGLGRACEGKGELKAALDWYRIAYENNPPVPQFEASVQRVTDKLREAGISVDDGYRLGDFSFGRGQGHEGMGNLRMAFVWYRSAHEFNPAVPEFAEAHKRLAKAIGEPEPG